MKRRSALSLTGCVVAGYAMSGIAQTQRVMRLGNLSIFPVSTDEQWRQAMHARGWEVGRNLVVERRFTMGIPGRLASLANELVSAHVDVIMAEGDYAALAAFNATRTIPIVMHGTAPVEMGLAQSLARPGGNVTGIVYYADGYAGKQLEIIRAIQPALKRMGFPMLPNVLPLKVVLAGWTAIAEKMGVTMVELPWPMTVADIDSTLAAALRERVQAFEFTFNPALRGAGWQQITAWAVSNKVLTSAAEYARGEAAFTFGANGPRFRDQIFDQIDRVLRGANPAEMPIQRPTLFDIVINRKIIQAMGLTVPRSVLLQATEVID